MKKKKFEEKSRLSIITPCYQDSDTIKQAVDSFFDQDYKNIEVIVVNDGSTDKTKEVLDKLEKKYKKRLFKVIHLTENQGACVARNEGAVIATGDYFSFLPADSILFPSVARIWVETLDKETAYGFLYGAYKIRFSNGQDWDYMADEFDPYHLEAQNYIDGSFPLRRKIFEEVGGWDSSVKSLQDWDFWLRVVKKGYKGLYRPEVFFETTAPHPGGLSDDSHKNWLERTSFIKERNGIPERKICVTSMGCRYHARNLAKILNADFRDAPQMKQHNYELIYKIGYYPQFIDNSVPNVPQFMENQSFNNFSGVRAIHWVGSDILQIAQFSPYHRANLLNWFDHNIDYHFCECGWTQVELKKYGIEAKIVPLPPKKFYESTPLPKEFAVAIYQPFQNKELYFDKMMMEIADEMKDIKFNFFGDPGKVGVKKNVSYVGKVADDKMQDFININSCLLRITVHDGMPLSAIEFISAGRWVIFGSGNLVWDEKLLPKEFVIVDRPEKATIKKAIYKAKELSEKIGLNLEGKKYWEEVCDPEKYRETIYDLIKYDAKKYWDFRAESWDRQVSDFIERKSLIEVEKVLKDLKINSIIDIGCGNGKWSEVFKKIFNNKIDYLGLDFSEYLIELAQKRYPDKNFQIFDAREIDKLGKTADLIFSSTCLLHFTEEEVKEFKEKASKIAKYLLLIEPTREVEKQNTIGRILTDFALEEKKRGIVLSGIKSSFVHKYEQIFNIEKIIKLNEQDDLILIKL